MSSRRMRSMELDGSRAQGDDDDDALPSTMRPKKPVKKPAGAALPPPPTKVSVAPTKQPKQVKASRAPKEEEDVDAILAAHVPRMCDPLLPLPETTTSDPCDIDACYLDAEAEMKRQLSTSKAHKRPLHVFVAPSPDWPPMDPDQLVTVLVVGGAATNTFKLVASERYAEATSAFDFAVATMDNHALQSILHRHPFHLPTLYQMANILSLTGQSNEARGYLNMAMYALAHIPRFSSFSWLKSHRKRTLPYNVNTSVVFHILKEYIHCLLRQGCHRTAFEYGKVLYSLDPSDPMRVLLLLDYAAIKSGCFRSLLDITPCLAVPLPTLSFSCALCEFLLGGNNNTVSATSSLRIAHARYPGVMSVMMGEEEVEGPAPSHPILARLATVYEARNRELWNSKVEVRNWAVGVCKEVGLAQEGILPLDDARLDVYDLVGVDEVMGRVQMIPADVLREAQEPPPDLEQGVAVPYTHATWERMQEVLGPAPEGLTGHETIQYYQHIMGESEGRLGEEQHPFMLFLRSLLPWNSVERMALENEERRRNNNPNLPPPPPPQA